MNDTLNWAKKMGKAGFYKSRQTARWLKRVPLGTRIKMTEELLDMESDAGHVKAASLFRSLSKLLERQHVG
ncbi:MAG: hypothetical protein HY811_08840 [Planctomycetes bacterium]|nr:hypothetical protein [Planctomycetota bacterium]